LKIFKGINEKDLEIDLMAKIKHSI